MSQSHSNFKVFISTPSASDELSPEVCAEVSRFAADNLVAARSIGIEFVEAQNKLVLSLGYTKGDEPSFPIKLQCVPLGKLALDADVIGNAISAAVANVKDVICHEFYVDREGEFFLVLMSDVS